MTLVFFGLVLLGLQIMFVGFMIERALERIKDTLEKKL